MTQLPANMALQRTRRPRLRSGRSLRSLGSPLNAYPLARSGIVLVLGLAFAPSPVSTSAPTRTPTAVRSDCAMVEAVLTSDGHVKSARIAKSAGTQFDRRALAFVRARRYAVPKKNTKPLYLSVAVCPHELR